MTDRTRPITTEVKLREIKRELGQRRHVYARLVAAGKLSQATADWQIAVLEAVQRDYEALIEAEQAEGKLL